MSIVGMGQMKHAALITSDVALPSITFPKQANVTAS